MNYLAAQDHILNRLISDLSDELYYHGVHHTLDVIEVTKELSKLENISDYELTLLKTAACYHDCGFLISTKEHEKIGCGIVMESLPKFGYNEDEINIICDMIMATKIPQSPKNHLEQILCDADLDYLGREDFYPIGNTLFEELKAQKIVADSLTWNNIQIKFLESHQFHTNTNRERRTDQKLKYLSELKELVSK